MVECDVLSPEDIESAEQEHFTATEGIDDVDETFRCVPEPFLDEECCDAIEVRGMNQDGQIVVRVCEHHRWAIDDALGRVPIEDMLVWFAART